jgi:hypothetical protein
LIRRCAHGRIAHIFRAGARFAYALQQLINGVTLGMIYGLIAVGYTIVYGIIGQQNIRDRHAVPGAIGPGRLGRQPNLQRLQPGREPV